MEENKTQLGVTLKGATKRRFEAIKNYYGLEKNADLIRLLITDKYEQLEKERKIP